MGETFLDLKEKGKGCENLVSGKKRNFPRLIVPVARIDSENSSSQANIF